MCRAHRDENGSSSGAKYRVRRGTPPRRWTAAKLGCADTPIVVGRSGGRRTSQRERQTGPATPGSTSTAPGRSKAGGIQRRTGRRRSARISLEDHLVLQEEHVAGHEDARRRARELIGRVALLEPHDQRAVRHADALLRSTEDSRPGRPVVEPGELVEPDAVRIGSAEHPLESVGRGLVDGEVDPSVGDGGGRGVPPEALREGDVERRSRRARRPPGCSSRRAWRYGRRRTESLPGGSPEAPRACCRPRR